jgi:hypothetical protein
MRYAYHIITPFSRWQNFMTLARHLKPMGVVWHPVFDSEISVYFGDEWIKSMVCGKCPRGFFPGYWMTNWYLDHAPVCGIAIRYLILNDDDLYEEGFFEKVDAVDGELLICSMRRGEELLKGCAENFKQAFVGGEQLIVSGRLMREERYEGHYEADWGVISRLAEKEAPVYVPEAVVKFNCLPR